MAVLCLPPGSDALDGTLRLARLANGGECRSLGYDGIHAGATSCLPPAGWGMVAIRYVVGVAGGVRNSPSTTLAWMVTGLGASMMMETWMASPVGVRPSLRLRRPATSRTVMPAW